MKNGTKAAGIELRSNTGIELRSKQCCKQPFCSVMHHTFCVLGMCNIKIGVSRWFCLWALSFQNLNLECHMQQYIDSVIELLWFRDNFVREAKTAADSMKAILFFTSVGLVTSPGQQR